ncbi:hypothetical protein Dda_0213 [Drechslerella dactyloides]|uniref:Uncharacterized protein n=1 Tax=Drechslerella dactyloides TaxID=74499 RepID=A0AAD6J7M3_DREDA|nr:hypothetical protein Dda_0213 [Drechslerella dactyloides]
MPELHPGPLWFKLRMFRLCIWVQVSIIASTIIAALAITAKCAPAGEDSWSVVDQKAWSEAKETFGRRCDVTWEAVNKVVFVIGFGSQGS